MSASIVVIHLFISLFTVESVSVTAISAQIDVDAQGAVGYTPTDPPTTTIA